VETAVSRSDDGVVLSVDRLSYQYPNGQPALMDVSFRVGVGEVVGLVGPNGAGKTTLLLHLNGLLADVDISDPPAVEVMGLPVRPPYLNEVRRNVGLLFQDPDDQLFCGTVGEDVAFGPRNLSLPEEEVRRRVAESLAAVGLQGYESRGTQEMSFGERRRACLAGVLACEPVLLALDEPSSNLDPRSRRKMIGVLRDCPVSQLIASHDLELILELCTRVLILDGGRIRADGPPRQLFTDERLMQSHGLERPLSLR
jgi:cobalt/nickel transport system ATP-binding protein